MLKRIAAFVALLILVPLSARSAAAATATVQYIIPQGGDPKVMTFGAVPMSRADR